MAAPEALTALVVVGAAAAVWIALRNRDKPPAPDPQVVPSSASSEALPPSQVVQSGPEPRLGGIHTPELELPGMPGSNPFIDGTLQLG